MPDHEEYSLLDVLLVFFMALCCATVVITVYYGIWKILEKWFFEFGATFAP